MITSIAIQNIHDALPSRNEQAIAAVHAGAFDTTDWQAMWRQRGVRLERLATELEEITRQRDQLARRCAEQARHIAGLLDLKAEENTDGPSVADAITVMQRTGQAR